MRCLQVQEQCEQCREQVLQEQELRSVAEKALLEERNQWRQVQRLCHDTRTRCIQISESLLAIRSVILCI